MPTNVKIIPSKRVYPSTFFTLAWPGLLVLKLREKGGDRLSVSLLQASMQAGERPAQGHTKQIPLGEFKINQQKEKKRVCEKPAEGREHLSYHRF
jgi:hypothetical protein